MEEVSCDVAVIGAGSAGLAAREAAVEAGAHTVLIESGPGGTTCARTGCMPSKLLIAAADAAHGAASLETFGLRLDGRVEVDGPAVLARLRAERDHFVGSVLEEVDRIPAEDRRAGRARFLDAGTLAVGERRLRAKAVVIATGASPVIPKALDSLGDLLLTNESVFELPDLPASLAVVGAGPLGIELALAFSRLGTAVTLFDEGEAMAGLSDPEVAGAARTLFAAALPLHLGVKLSGRPEGGEAELSWTAKNGTRAADGFEKVLVATGRRPNLGGLDLGTTGLALGPHGVPAFDPATMRCGMSAIFLAGDVDQDRPVLHEAAEEGRIAGTNAARYPDTAPSPRWVPISVVYSRPEAAHVGPPWPKLDDPEIGSADLSKSGRARVEGRNAGLLRVYAERGSGRMIGGEMVGPEAEHLAHLLAWSVQCGLTAEQMLALPFYHPSLEESLRTALRDICGKLGTRARRRDGSMDYGPG